MCFVIGSRFAISPLPARAAAAPGALALDAPYLPPSSRLAMSGRYGNFEGASAVLLSGAVRVSSALQFDAGLAYGVSHGNLGGTVGFTVNW